MTTTVNLPIPHVLVKSERRQFFTMPAAYYASHHPPPHKPGTRPTVGQVSAFIQALFPIRNGDINFAFHSPRIRHGPSNTLTFLNPLHNRSPVSRVVLSITPTTGFYTAIDTVDGSKPEGGGHHEGKRGGSPHTPLGFLHRPWALDRRRMPRRATILANHKGFDEVLTTGNNVALGRRLGMDVDRAAVIQGYKGDPDRTIALIGLVGDDNTGISRANILDVLEKEFGTFEGVFGFGFDGTPLPSDNVHGQEPKAGAHNATQNDIEKDAVAAEPNTQQDIPIRIIAIMNAFHPAEVEQVEAIAQSLISSSPPPTSTPDIATGVKDSAQSQDRALEAVQGPANQGKSDCGHVLYLTGAVREPGLEAARKRGMAVVCVGHRVCEEWGIRHMARLLRDEWPSLVVDEILEDESMMPEAGEQAKVAMGKGPVDQVSWGSQA